MALSRPRVGNHIWGVGRNASTRNRGRIILSRPEIRFQVSRLVSLLCGCFLLVVLVNLCLPTCTIGVSGASRGEIGQAVKSALAVGYRHIDGARAYGVRTSTFPRSTHKPKYLHTERARGWRRDQGKRDSSGGHLHHIESMRPPRLESSDG